MRTPQTFFSIAQVFQEKYYLALARLEIFSKSRLRLNLGYGKSRLTFADKTPGQGKRKAATPEKLKYLSPLKGGLKPGSTIGYRSTRNDPCPADECLRSSAGQGSFRVLLSGLCRSVKSQALLSGWLHRTNLSGNSLPQPGGWGGVYLCVRDCSGKPTAFRRGLGGGKPDRLRERPNPPKEKRTNTLKY